MTKKEFVTQVSEMTEDTLKLSPKQVDQVLDTMLFVLKEQLLAEDSVRLSHFGIFTTVVKPQRTIINRFSKQEQVVPQKRVIKYKPSKYLRDLLDFK
ncbi:bacterial nucleoid DNA-binding protein [Mycoplasmopsis canis UFG4]|uniref:Bacterial nucleoid DNA-binding protein n=2 Tax=Mycoplasmopsis canis TaxID=29555 RepID=I1A7E0_9BACT|nr:HU family DNA-binding protein [Mycoplasmopsis canis]AKF40891.1 DNA-binding protein [Mycoplasmopsis canis]AMD81001.1 DNA-binding protein [Mycoplasmopsis canis PG 14]EIE40976.1 bacterial nucleoid DNA-binding protein [Mycoplasmopsis canis PG 14]EIE41053.1 bacterial nucleoid DNA-binding protein [Mycoplasmopsis canis UF31]EIE41177.1 bacterial nucleoid DNA-binding protein [Mycoplasmopsis canis UF33]